MLRISLLIITVLCTGCMTTEIRIQGQYADTRIFAKDGEVGIAMRPKIVILTESNQFTR